MSVSSFTSTTRAPDPHKQIPDPSWPGHIRNIRLRVRFLFPQIKGNIQIIVISFKVCYRNLHDMIPESHIAGLSLLQKVRCLQSLVAVILILFGFSAGAGINLFQFSNGKRRFCRIFPLIAVVKIYQLRFAVFQFCDDQPI